MFIAKLVMYGVLGVVMGVFGIGVMTNFTAWVSILSCVFVIDLLATVDK